MEPAHFTNNIYYTEITVQTSTSSHQPWRQKTEITKGIYYWQHLSIFYLVLLIHNLDTILHLHTTNNLIHFFLLLLSELNPLIIIKLLQRTELLQVLNTYFTCKFQQTSTYQLCRNLHQKKANSIYLPARNQYRKKSLCSKTCFPTNKPIRNAPRFPKTVHYLGCFPCQERRNRLITSTQHKEY